MTLKHFMAAQMRKPSGWFGSVILRRLLNRMNMAVVESTISRIGFEPHHPVLEPGQVTDREILSTSKVGILGMPLIAGPTRVMSMNLRSYEHSCFPRDGIFAKMPLDWTRMAGEYLIFLTLN
jgi:hypothetical protein